MKYYTTDLEKTSRRLFPIYLSLLAISSFPFGANRPWAWSILAIVTFLLLAVYCFQYARGNIRAPELSGDAKIVASCLIAWLGYQCFQIMTIPRELLDILSPLVASLDMTDNDRFVRASSSISIDRMNSVLDLIKSFLYVGIFILTILLVNRRDRLRTLMLVMVISGVFQAVIGLTLSLMAQGGSFESISTNAEDVVKGTFINRNHFAGFMNMTIAASIGLLIAVGVREKRQIHRERHRHHWQSRMLDWRVYLAFYCALMIMALIFSQSRGAWASFSVMLIIGGIMISMQKINFKDVISNYASVVVVLLFALFVVSGEVLVDRMSTVGMDLPLRMDIWSNSLSLIKDNWLTGVGSGNFQYIYPLYDSGLMGKRVEHAHNDYLELLIEQGIIGLSLIAIAVIIAIKNAFFSGIKVRNGGENAFAIGSLMAITSILVHSFVDFNFQIPSNTMYFFAFVGVATLQGVKSIQMEKRDIAWDESAFNTTYSSLDLDNSQTKSHAKLAQRRT